MNKLTGAYEDIANVTENIKTRTRAAVKEFFPYIILILNIAFTVASRLFSTWLENPFTPDFFITLASNILTTMFCYACFVSYGERIGKHTIRGYNENCERWSELSCKIRAEKSEQFIKYCKDRTDAEREEKRQAILRNHTMIKLEDYESLYRGLNFHSLWRKRKEYGLSLKETFFVALANGNIRVKPIKPLLILCGVKASHINDAGRSKLPASAFSIMMRPLLMFVLSACITMFKGSFVGVADSSAIYDMILSGLSIIISSIVGYSAGFSSAKKELKTIISRIFFLEHFERTI